MISLWAALLVLLCTPPFAYVGWSLATRSDSLGVYERVLRMYTHRPALPPAHVVQERIALLELDLGYAPHPTTQLLKAQNKARQTIQHHLSYRLKSDTRFVLTLSNKGLALSPTAQRIMIQQAELLATSLSAAVLQGMPLPPELTLVRTETHITSTNTLNAIDAYAEHLRKRKDAQS